MEFQETNGIQTGSGIKLVIYGQEGVGGGRLSSASDVCVLLYICRQHGKDRCYQGIFLVGTGNEHVAVQRDFVPVYQ